MRGNEMSRKWKIGLLILLAIIITIETIILGQVETKYFSAYAACRDVAMKTKGYGVWKHVSTTPTPPTIRVMFDDGTNDFGCETIGIGPFWIAMLTWQTLVGCVKSFNPILETCPEDYFGVSP